MDLRKWPRRNDAESIGARREAIRAVVGDEPLAHDDEAWTRAQESHTGAAVIPVAVVGPLVVELGSYELEEPQGTLRETGRAQEELLVPLAHTEGGLSASMSRGMKAAAISGGFRTYVLHDRMTRASCFICKNTEDAVHLARWLEDSVDDLRAFLAALDDPTLSKRAKLREVKTHVVGLDVPCAVGLDDRRRVRAEHDDPQQLRAEHGLRAPAGAREAGAGDPRGEHGRRQEAVVRVLPVRARQDGARGGDARRGDGPARAADDRRRPARALVGGHARRRRLRDAVGRVHACFGDRRDLRLHRPGPRDGRHELDGARNGPPHRGRRAHAAIRFPGLEVGTVGGGTTLPYARSWLALLDCAGTGKVHRFAQIIAAAALALEISASSAMATAGSENFFRAHHERGGMR